MILKGAKGFEKLCQYVKEGQVVGVPTDTVYGLVSRVSSQEGLETIYREKGRSKSKKCIQFISEIEDISYIFDYEYRLAKAVWPGKVTLLLQKEESDEKEGYRIPDSTLIREVIRYVGEPLYSTSANRSGAMPVVTAKEFEKIFPNIPVYEDDMIITGQPSTIVDVQGKEEDYRIIR